MCAFILLTYFPTYINIIRHLSSDLYSNDMSSKLYLSASTFTHTNWSFYTTCTCTYYLNQSGHNETKAN